jgi:ATP-dependent Clp protease ATP-binding subunit ClpA
MGVTKQAAQKRFVPRWGDDLLGSGRTFSRFTDRARNVVVMANRLASGAGLNAITPAHLVAAMYSEPEGFAARALNELGTTLEVIAREIGVDQTRGDIVDSMSFDADTMRSLESALHAALRLRHNYIGTEHLLLGVLALPDLDVTRRLAAIGVTTETFEPWVIDALEQHLAGRDTA